MRRFGRIAVSALLMSLPIALPARAAPPGFTEAQRAFEGDLDPQTRQIVQVRLIAAGYMTAIPSDRFSTRTFEALKRFQSDNGFVPTGRLGKAQVERLFAIGDPMFAAWGLQRVLLPGHDAAIWVPFGLDLQVHRTDKGLSYKDRQGRFSVIFQSRPKVTALASLKYLLRKAEEDGTIVNYKEMKDGWFALSTTKADWSDHYYRYHQQGPHLVGFAMDWNNRIGDVHAERLAVLDSAVLAASMAGEPFIDPPRAEAAVASAVNFAVKAGMVAQFLDANRVAYRTAAAGAPTLPPADIADQARAMSAFVVCR